MHGATIKRIACALGLIARSDFSFTRTAHAIPVGVIGNAEGTKQALALCDQFQIDFRATREMVEKIDAHGLFAPRQSKVTLEGGEVLNLTDFQVIDKAAFNKLSDAAFLDLRKSGALGLLYCHLASTNSWTSVVHQASLRKAER